MRPIKIEQLIEGTQGKLISGAGPEDIEKVVIDSREADETALFVAIIGEVHDAHKFIGGAYENGCRTFLISKESAAEGYDDCTFVLVENTEDALGKLAKWYLDSLNLRKIALTGSMGKTTTRDMIYAMSSTTYKTGKPIKNYNSLIGISMTILAFEADTEVAVVEVGMESLGEIHRMVDMIRPEIALVTYVGMTHIESLGSRENIYKAKMEITDFLNSNDTFIINEKCPVLDRTRINGDYNLMTIGDENNDFIVSNLKDLGSLGIEFSITHDGKKYDIALDILGAHNAYNCAMAMAAVSRLGIDVETAIDGLKNLKVTDKRLAVKKNKGITIIDDSYSNFPEAGRAVINTLKLTEGTRHIAIFAGMNGLGEEHEKQHLGLGAYCRDKKVDLLIAVGSKGNFIAQGALGGDTKVIYVSDKELLYPYLDVLLKEGDVVSVKGSRTFAMETVVEHLLNM